MLFAKYNNAIMADRSKGENIEEESKQCESCGGTLIPEKMKLEEFEDGKLYVINDAPVMACQSCGEVWVPEKILDELEQMIEVTRKQKTIKLKKIKVLKNAKKKQHNKLKR